MKKIFRSFYGIIGIILGVALIAIPSYYFMEKDIIIGNLGYIFYCFEVFFSFIISILFGVFLGGTLYKINYFQVKKSSLGFLGGLLAILVSGCPACSITFASYIGLASIISIFPFFGLELKIISIGLLIYVNYSVLKDLETCKMKK